VTDPTDRPGYFGRFGGRFVPETLMGPLEDLERGYRRARRDPAFARDLTSLLAGYAGRPTPVHRARRLERSWGTGPLYLKREDLSHTGAHKINNTLGQVLLAKRLGKVRAVAETGAGQHGVAAATACALMGLECVVYMGERDMSRQATNVERMRFLGARVIPVRTGARTLKDATGEAIRYWVANVRNTHYVLGSAVGPDPYPALVRDFQSVIGREARRQILEQVGRLPDLLVACVGGGSNAVGLFHPFRDDPVEMLGVEAGGDGRGAGASSLVAGSPGVLHGCLSYLLQDGNGQVLETQSAAAGLDYPGVGPEHSHWKETGRVRYVSATDDEALRAFRETARLEGILPALEPAHALARVRGMGSGLAGRIVLLCLSGRGDKDLAAVAALEGRDGKEGSA
jgi:tryptophan synthase beta chain